MTEHDHHDIRSAAAHHRGRLIIVLSLTAAYMIVELVGGLLTNSLALVADGAHMLIDAVALGGALAAIWVAQKPATPEHTYGHQRVEILAGLANAAFLLALSAGLLFEASRRLLDVPEVRSAPMLVVATVGLLVNAVGALLLREGAAESLNVRGAFLHVLSDMLGSAGAMLAALVMLLTGWHYADPLATLLTTALILVRTWDLLRETVGVLLEGTPNHLKLAEVRSALEDVPAVDSIHDLHVWVITSGYLALSAHARVGPRADANEILAALHRVARERFAIEHCTIQLEEPGFEEAPTHA